MHRRRLLTLGVLSAAVLALGGGALALLQRSVYGIVNRLAQGLAKRLSGQDVILA